MTDNTAGNNPQSRPEVPRPALTRASAGRRRLLGGIVGAPIVALAARPALAAQCTMSGAHSAFFASHHPGQHCNLGLSPGFWKENWHNWPSQYSCGSPSSGGKNSGGGKHGHQYLSFSMFATASTNSSQGNTPFIGGTSFEAAFGTGPRTFDAYYNGEPISLMNAMRLHPGSPEFHWVAALLNSVSVQGYPYSSGDIINMWQDPQIAGQGVTYQDIATFFQNYLES